MDRLGADFYHTVDMIKERLRGKVLPIQLPLGKEKLFQGIIDIAQNKAYAFPNDPAQNPIEVAIPEDERVMIAKYRQALIEQLAGNDDEIMLAYLEGKEIAIPQLKAAIRKLTVANQIVPVLCGSALRNKGIHPLLNAIIDYLPSPLDIPAAHAIDLKTEEETFCQVSSEAPFSALAFKVVSDPFMGRLVYFRVYSGKIASGATIFNSTSALL